MPQVMVFWPLLPQSGKDEEMNFWGKSTLMTFSTFKMLGFVDNDTVGWHAEESALDWTSLKS